MEAATIGDLLDARLTDAEGRVVDSSNMKYFLGRLREFFGPMSPTSLNAELVKSYWRHRGSAVTACTRELEELRSAFLLAKRRGLIDAVPEIPMPAKRPPRDVFMTQEEARRLLAAAISAHVRLFIWIGFTTAQRKGAILGLTWDRVDLDRGILDFQDPTRAITKKRRATTRVSDPSLLTALREARKVALTEFVIEHNGEPVANIKKAFREAALRAGLFRWERSALVKRPLPHTPIRLNVWATPHVLKHSAISWLAEAGVTVDQISDFSQTSPATVRRVYRKVNPESLDPLADILAGALISPPAKETPEGDLPQVIGKTGARDGIRTRDPLDHNDTAYRAKRLKA